MRNRELAEQLFHVAFAQTRSERSEIYKAGVIAALRRHCVGSWKKSPYEAGSVEFDAFYAGVDEGNALWREYELSSSKSE